MTTQSILTFNASVAGNYKTIISALTELDGAFQIMPARANVLRDSDIEGFPTRQGKELRKKVLIHSSYITRPWSMEPRDVTIRSIRSYIKLAQQLAVTNLLIHLPASKLETECFPFGLQRLFSTLLDAAPDVKLQLEIECPTKDLRLHLAKQLSKEELNENEKPNVSRPFTELLKSWFASIPEAYRPRIGFVPDTAHLHAAGFTAKQMVELIDELRPIIDFIHLNGNSKNMNQSDVHAAIFSPENRIAGWEELCRHIAGLGVVVIVEASDANEHHTYPDWVKFAEQFGFSIVGESRVYVY